MPAAKWTKDLAKEVALKYTSRGDLKKYDNGAYIWIRRNGLLEELCSHMVSKFACWGKGQAFIEALKFTTRNDFQRNGRGAWQWLHRRGLLDDACKHMVCAMIALRGEFFPIKHKTGIYFLYDEDEIVYIGKSNKGIGKRIKDHCREDDKQFTKVVVYSIENVADTNIVELYLIALHSPKYNKECNHVDVPTIVINNLDDIIIEEIEFNVKGKDK